MLFMAGHAKNDIPSVLNTYTAETGLLIDYGRELGVDRLMVAAAGARIQRPWIVPTLMSPFPRPCWWWWDVGPQTPTPIQCGQGDPMLVEGWLWLG